MRSKEEDEKTVIYDDTPKKREWVKPDIHLYPIGNTLSGGAGSDDGSTLS